MMMLNFKTITTNKVAKQREVLVMVMMTGKTRLNKDELYWLTKLNKDELTEHCAILTFIIFTQYILCLHA